MPLELEYFAGLESNSRDLYFVTGKTSTITPTSWHEDGRVNEMRYPWRQAQPETGCAENRRKCSSCVSRHSLIESFLVRAWLLKMMFVRG